LNETNKLMTLSYPKLKEAIAVINEAFTQRRTLIVAGLCSVYYIGRAKSTLEPGERLLIIKEDSSLLVHRPTGYEPVNWQPQGSIFHVQLNPNGLEVHAIRQKPRESVKILFTAIYLVASLNLKDTGVFSLNATEADMHKAILLKPALIEEGLKPVSYEKKVEPGFVDIYAEDKAGNMVVIEVKRKTAGKEAAIQLSRYIESIKEKANKQIRGILVAPTLAKDTQRILESLNIEFKDLDPKKCAQILKRNSDKKLETFFPTKKDPRP
jgi:RecB family endonuclease NucS